jgi:hypothetical protein
MSDQPKTPVERWQAKVDAETAALRAEFEQRYAGNTDQEIAERAAQAIAKFGRPQS